MAVCIQFRDLATMDDRTSGRCESIGELRTGCDLLDPQVDRSQKRLSARRAHFSIGGHVTGDQVVCALAITSVLLIPIDICRMWWSIDSSTFCRQADRLSPRQRRVALTMEEPNRHSSVNALGTGRSVGIMYRCVSREACEDCINRSLSWIVNIVQASRLILLPKRPYRALLRSCISSLSSLIRSSSFVTSPSIFSTDEESRSWTSGTARLKKVSPILYLS